MGRVSLLSTSPSLHVRNPRVAKRRKTFQQRSSRFEAPVARRRDARHERCSFPGTARIGFVNEARLEDAGSGLAPVTEGWFVVNMRDAEWFSSKTRGSACWFANEYGERPIEFPQFGINVTVLEPGQSSVYHAEANQEAFLVLAGECRLLVEGQERLLRPWDFFHSPAWTEHAFVGAGDRPCAVLMVGAHVSPEVRYPVSDLAARYGASVQSETSDPEQVYATAERFQRGRPPYWSRLPWS